MVLLGQPCQNVPAAGRGVNKGMQICRSVPIFRQICRSPKTFVQIHPETEVLVRVQRSTGKCERHC